MKFSVLTFICATLTFFGCKENAKSVKTDEISEIAQNNEEDEVIFPIYDFEGLEPLLNKNDDKIYIVNFWATWCKPCIKELPDFERLYAEEKENGVELILVSLDMPSMWKSKLEPFVEKNELKGKVVILDDPKMNDWIPKVDEDWGGGIPATLIYNRYGRAFYERGFSYKELKEELNKLQKRTNENS